MIAWIFKEQGARENHVKIMKKTKLLKIIGLFLWMVPLWGQAQTPLPPPEIHQSEPEVMASDLTPDPNEKPDIRIIQKGNAKLEEYRLHGKLYMIKVIPHKGRPYYLVDHTGRGEFERFSDIDGQKLKVPQWVILEF